MGRSIFFFLVSLKVMEVAMAASAEDAESDEAAAIDGAVVVSAERATPKTASGFPSLVSDAL